METANVINIGTPEACAARLARINAAREQAKTRLFKITEARRLIREAGIVTCQEFKNLLECLNSNFDPGADTDCIEWRQRSIDIATDIEDAVHGVRA